MIPKRWENVQVQVAPHLRLSRKYCVVVGDVAGQRHIAIHDHRRGMLFGNLIHQPLADARIGLKRVRRIRKSLVAVSDERQRVGQFGTVDPERWPGFAQQMNVGRGVRRRSLSQRRR